MKTREYAVELRKIADFLDSRPEFDLQAKPKAYAYFFDKEAFLTAAKAIGNGTKDAGTTDFTFTAKDAAVKISIRRDQVCRKVKDAVWECEPLFSPEETESL